MHPTRDHGSKAPPHSRADGPCHPATRDRRASDRVGLCLPCIYVLSEISDDDELRIREGRGVVHDWSAGGMRVELTGPLDYPRMLEVRLDEAAQPTLWILDVCWSHRVPSGTKESRWFTGGRLLFARRP